MVFKSRFKSHQGCEKFLNGGHFERFVNFFDGHPDPFYLNFGVVHEIGFLTKNRKIEIFEKSGKIIFFEPKILAERASVFSKKGVFEKWQKSVKILRSENRDFGQKWQNGFWRECKIRREKR